MGSPNFSIRTVDDSGNLDKYLPDYQGLDISPVFSQAGTVVIKYPQNGVNFNLLAEDVEIAVTMDGVEVPTLRSIIEQIEGDDSSEASDAAVWTFTARTTMALFDRAVVYPQNWPSPGEPSYSYADVTPGFVLLDQINKAQARGSLLGITTTFTDSSDSNGVDWSTTIDALSFDAGTKLSDALQSLVDGGYVELKMSNRTLSAYFSPSLGNDLTTGPNALRFHAGRDIKESPRKISSRDLATTLLVAGSNSVYRERTSDPSVISQWGRRESYWSINISDNSSVIDFFGDRKLSTLNTPQLEVTHGLFFEDDINPRPIRDFDVGDWGLTDVGRGWERYQIKQWVVSVDENREITGSVTLNDLIAERIARINDQLNKLQNGTTIAGASEEVDDGKAPHAPTGVAISTDYYVDNGVSRAFISVDWSPVSTNADGSIATDMSYYVARWRYVGDSNWQQSQRVDVSTTVAYFADIFTNEQVEAQVQAVDKYNHASDWSASATATTARDLIAPNKPSAPVVTSNVGTLRVSWDGLDSTGQPQVADFKGVEVHIGTSGTFVPSSSTYRDFLTGASATTITGLAYGTDWFARLVAVDTSGNKSTPSDQTSTSHAVLTQVVNTEIGTGQVGLNNTAFSDVGNLVDDGNFEIATYRTARQSLITGTHLAFDSSTSSVGTWSLRSNSFSAGSIEYFTLQDALPVKPGERIFGAFDMRATSDATGKVNLDIAWLDSTGAVIGGGGFYPVASTDNGTKDNTWKARVTGTSQVAPATAASMRVILYSSSRTAGTMWVDAIELRRQIDTLLIADAAITTAQIADLAVNDAKIASASIGKLTAGSLTADMTVSARIKTANTGARVELNSSGLQVYNSGGVQTGNFNSANGSISIAGTLVTGFSGTRIEINPSGLPTIRLYSGAGTEYGFINGFTISGTDVGVGFNSSPFSGNGTQVGSRLVAFAGQCSMEIIRSDNQQTSGGYLYAYPDYSTGGYALLGDQGASWTAKATQFYIDADGSGHGYLDVTNTYAEVGIGQGSSTENSMFFTPTNTTMLGRWSNFASAFNNQGIFTGRFDVGAGFSGTTISYGPTMLSAMEPMCTIQSVTFDDTTGTSTTSPNWGISGGAGSFTSFSVGWDRGVAVAIMFWCFRV